MEYILETQGLTKVYGTKEAAKDVDLHIREGEIYGLIGRNGAGKTTIMRMISGLSTPTSGSYSLFGKTGYAMGRALRNVGVLIESPGLYPRLSARENLKIKCIGSGVRARGYVEELLKTVGLENTDMKKPAGSYSLGMRQRLGIALALVGDPKMIILDEPINGLDPQGIAEVRETVSRLRDERGITVMISSHILDELAKVADCFGIINEGRLLDEFSADELHKRRGRRHHDGNGRNAAGLRPSGRNGRYGQGPRRCRRSPEGNAPAEPLAGRLLPERHRRCAQWLTCSTWTCTGWSKPGASGSAWPCPFSFRWRIPRC